jgi:hypothetical protein
MTVGELLARTSAAELTEWQAYEEETGPLNAGHRADVHAGIVASTVANALRGKKSRRYQPADFVPNWGPAGRRPTQTWQEQLAIVEQLNRALGGRDNRRNRRGGDR